MSYTYTTEQFVFSCDLIGYELFITTTSVTDNNKWMTILGNNKDYSLHNIGEFFYKHKTLYPMKFYTPSNDLKICITVQTTTVELLILEPYTKEFSIKYELAEQRMIMLQKSYSIMCNASSYDKFYTQISEIYKEIKYMTNRDKGVDYSRLLGNYNTYTFDLIMTGTTINKQIEYLIKHCGYHNVDVLAKREQYLAVLNKYSYMKLTDFIILCRILDRNYGYLEKILEYPPVLHLFLAQGTFSYIQFKRILDYGNWCPTEMTDTYMTQLINAFTQMNSEESANFSIQLKKSCDKIINSNQSQTDL